MHSTFQPPPTNRYSFTPCPGKLQPQRSHLWPSIRHRVRGKGYSIEEQTPDFHWLHNAQIHTEMGRFATAFCVVIEQSCSNKWIRSHFHELSAGHALLSLEVGVILMLGLCPWEMKWDGHWGGSYDMKFGYGVGDWKCTILSNSDKMNGILLLLEISWCELSDLKIQQIRKIIFRIFLQNIKRKICYCFSKLSRVLLYL